MLDRPVVELVNELHWLGRRLAVLKRLYQSYELIMRRLLQRQRLLRDEARSNHPPALSFGATFGDMEFADMRKSSLVSNGSFPSTNDKPVGVILSSSAAARFERLVDRINLYCLSEIESCLTEKESLTFLVSAVIDHLLLHTLSGNVADIVLEFQPDRAQRLAGSREVDTNHNPVGQGNDLVPAGQSDDLLFFNGCAGSQGRIHQSGLLGEFWGDFGCVHGGANALRVCQRHGGREDHLSVDGEDLFPNWTPESGENVETGSIDPGRRIIMWAPRSHVLKKQAQRKARDPIKSGMSLSAWKLRRWLWVENNGSLSLSLSVCLSSFWPFRLSGISDTGNTVSFFSWGSHLVMIQQRRCLSRSNLVDE